MNERIYYEKLLNELKEYQYFGVCLKLNGQSAQPEEIAMACCICERGNYMRDYISLGENDAICELHFDYVRPS